MTNNTELFLAYVNSVGKDSTDVYEYEFFFTEHPENVWGEDWSEECPSACGDTLPDMSDIAEVKRIRTVIPFSCAQDQSCFSLQDMIDGCICCAYENISGYDEYPSPYRIVFQFGEDYKSVETKLASRSQFFEDIMKD